MLLLALGALALPAQEYSFEAAQTLLKKQCQGCHSGKTAAGGFDIAQVSSARSLADRAQTWSRAAGRVKRGEMPPKGVPGPDFESRERFVTWVDASLRSVACASGTVTGPPRVRRLNRDEYSATVRDLLNIHINAANALPADGAGGEGFDNAAETLFLSPIHAEKYLDAARRALDYALKDPKSRDKFLTAVPGAGLSPTDAARKVLQTFLPRAFRRPATDEEVSRYLALFTAGRKNGESFEDAISFALEGVLISPGFLFRVEDSGDYALASRLSYFLWGSMPDDALFELAARNQLHQPENLRGAGRTAC